jgi:hypothetical protein
MTRVDELKDRVRALEAREGAAGGRVAGRAPLWQVTAVDTSAGTCTVQGVRWDGSSLVADSTREKTGVLYDPNNEPSSGDRGHLKGLSGGQPFFFKKAAGGDEYLEWYDFANEDAKGSSLYALEYREDYDGSSWNTTTDAWRAYKADSPITVDADVTVRADILTGPTFIWEDEGMSSGDWFRVHASAGLYVYFILEDFDLSALDRSTLESLSTVADSQGVGIRGTAYLNSSLSANYVRADGSHFYAEVSLSSGDTIYGAAAICDDAFGVADSLYSSGLPTSDAFRYIYASPLDGVRFGLTNSVVTI